MDQGVSHEKVLSHKEKTRATAASQGKSSEEKDSRGVEHAERWPSYLTNGNNGSKETVYKT